MKEKKESSVSTISNARAVGMCNLIHITVKDVQRLHDQTCTQYLSDNIIDAYIR